VDAIPIWLLSENVLFIVGSQVASYSMSYKIMELYGVAAFLLQNPLVIFEILEMLHFFIYLPASFIKSMRSVFKKSELNMS
jgi:hypothetical protein